MTRVPRSYWEDVSSHRPFVNSIFKRMTVHDVKDFPKVLTSEFLQAGGASGRTLFRIYNCSLTKMLASLYPEYRQLCRDFLNDVIKENNLAKVEDITTLPIEYHT